jgi:hypothetical protein
MASWDIVGCLGGCLLFNAAMGPKLRKMDFFSFMGTIVLFAVINGWFWGEGVYYVF